MLTFFVNVFFGDNVRLTLLNSLVSKIFMKIQKLMTLVTKQSE